MALELWVYPILMVKKQMAGVFLFILLITMNRVSAEANQSIICPSVTTYTTTSKLPDSVFGIFDSKAHQYFALIDAITKKPTIQGQSTLGCYAKIQRDQTVQSTPESIFVIGEDELGFYWMDSGGKKDRLQWDSKLLRFNFPNSNLKPNERSLYLDLNFESDNSATCKLIDRTGTYFGPGFFKSSLPTWKKEILHYKVVVPEFEEINDIYKNEFESSIDIDQTVKELDTEKVSEYYSAMSNGKVKVNFDVVKLSSKIALWPEKYRKLDYKNDTKRFHLEVVQKFKKIYNLSNYDGIVVALPKEYRYGGANFHAKLSEISGDESDAGKSYMFISTGFYVQASKHYYLNPKANWEEIAESGQNSPSWRMKPWRVIAHEIGHAFGFPDIYHTFGGGKTAIRDDDGETVGPFDIMGGLQGGLELNFWNKWMAGWLNDDEVKCLTSIQSPVSVNVYSISSNYPEVKGVVIPISRTTALLVESRQAERYDSDLDRPKAHPSLKQDKGLLVYFLDVTFPSSTSSPLRVISKVSEYTEIPFGTGKYNDYFRFMKAPIRPGELIKFNGITLINTGFSGIDQLTVLQDTSSEQNQQVEQIILRAQQEAKAKADIKAAAELKAKQEAEAKAAAELKAKQEAEAKAAAELKAKQEADAKAAAELKAKQEAEAKAAAELKAKQEADAKAAADKAAAELKAKQEADAKAAADKAAAELKAKQQAAAKAAATKKKTITCVKGKLSKKVTAAKPVCPPGYKKK